MLFSDIIEKSTKVPIINIKIGDDNDLDCEALLKLVNTLKTKLLPG